MIFRDIPERDETIEEDMNGTMKQRSPNLINIDGIIEMKSFDDTSSRWIKGVNKTSYRNTNFNRYPNNTTF